MLFVRKSTYKKLEDNVVASLVRQREDYEAMLMLTKQDYDSSLQQLQDDYNEELAKMVKENEGLLSENNGLLEDVALALLGEKVAKRLKKSTNRVFKAIKKKLLPERELMPIISKDKAGIEKLETKLKTIPDGRTGTGGIDVVENGKVVQLDFTSKKELKKILKDAKAGKIKIASQEW